MSHKQRDILLNELCVKCMEAFSKQKYTHQILISALKTTSGLHKLQQRASFLITCCERDHEIAQNHPLYIIYILTMLIAKPAFAHESPSRLFYLLVVSKPRAKLACGNVTPNSWRKLTSFLTARGGNEVRTLDAMLQPSRPHRL